MPATARTPAKSRVRELPRAEYVEPMKALGVERVPAGDWRCEIKFDGYRAVAVLNDGEVELWSRNHKSMTHDYPEVVEGLKRVGCRSAVLDGEIVALDAEGRSHFQLLQNRGRAGTRPTIVFYVFDLLQRDGASWLERPIEDRQSALRALLKKSRGAVQLSPWFDLAPEELLEAARAKGLEGIIAKRRGSRYEPGRRSGAWVKRKLVNEQEFVIGGFTPPQNSREHFGAILVGVYREGGLHYAGKVGTGFDRAGLKALHALFHARRDARCPFVDLPRNSRPRFGTGMTLAEMAKVTWLRPELVAQVKFSEWTEDGILRHPSFLGLRSDKAPTEVRREIGKG